MSSSFLFVNKDAGSSSLTRSTAAEQSSINSHVQRGRRHIRSGNHSGRTTSRARRKSIRDISNEEKDGIKGDVTSQGTDHQDNLPPSHRRTSTSSELPSRSRSLTHGSTVSATSQSITFESRADNIPEHSTSGKSRAGRRSSIISPVSPRAHLPSPQDITQFSSNHLDPSALSATKLDSHAATLCNYFADIYHPSVWNAERWGSQDGRYTHLPSARVIVQRAMQSDIEMNAMLACMASRRENVDGLSNQGTDKYMGSALMAARKSFATASKDQLLIVIFHLFAGEAYRQNYQAAAIHMKAAKNLFSWWGGINNVPDPAVRELFILGDLHMSAVVLQPCQLPCVYDPGPYWATTPPDLQLAPEQGLERAAMGFRGASMDDFLPKQLDIVVDEIAECAWVLHNGTQKPSATSQHAVKWVQWRSAAIRYRLLALEFSDPSLEAIRVALLLWVLITTVLLGLRMLGPRIAPKLQLLLYTASNARHHWRNQVEIQMWVTSMGAMCAVPDSEIESWYVRKLVDLGLAENIRLFRKIHGPATTTVDVLKNFHEKFFYYDKVQRPRLERLAKLLLVDSNLTAQGTPPDSVSQKTSPT
ncbi:hypothetical protein B0A52_02913 [Exophiala mesophila]|uniref:Transcription factor domain-containing protein n=1 Tax=Exophiala mesophila TaxID=212818 RepID=A0A438NC95_EXOME|nr:hypothetical protein B0A52_02913 [Exophiala mesophila]